jgi:hypothetical protein
MFVSNECCVLSGRDLCVGLIIRPNEGGVSAWMEKPRQRGGPGPLGLYTMKKIYMHVYNVECINAYGNKVF